MLSTKLQRYYLERVLYMDFAMKLKQERQRLGISQVKLAMMSGLTQRTIAAYETREVIARYNNVVKVANALDVPVEYLLYDDVQEPTVYERRVV